jgi:D-aminopeptidase
VPVWRELKPTAPAGDLPSRAGSHNPSPATGSHNPEAWLPPSGGRISDADGSCMIVVATDAPLDARDLKRLAARAIYALARTGSTYSNGSGDFAIAFSTHASLRVTNAAGPQPRTVLPTDSISGLFEAVMDATEEAVYNSLLKAVDTTGNGRTVRALPIDGLKTLLKIR